MMKLFARLFKRPNGDAPSGDASIGDASIGDGSNGDAPNGDAPSGDAPSGDTTSDTLAEALTRRYIEGGVISAYYKAANSCELTWASLSKVHLMNFVDYMGKHMCANSVNQYATKLKAVLNLYSDEVELPKGYAKVLSPKKEKVQNVFLSEDECKRFMAYEPKTDKEALVQAQFSIGVLTLARHSDYITFDSANLINGNLSYVSQKTRIQSTIPASPTLIRFLDIQKDLIEKGVTVHDNGFNKIVRRICEQVGIDEPIKLYQRGQTMTKPKWQFVSSHTARRTGVTNLYLRGLDLLTISKLAGHTDTKTTLGYVCCGIRELPQEAKDYFDGF